MAEQPILYINACVRKTSRTQILAQCLLEKLGGSYEEVRLETISFPKTDERYLEKRDLLIREGKYEDDLFALARQFAAAETIVIATPYWDLSFPASLKQYIEHINVLGITFEYTDDGYPVGLCKAKKLWYVTTAGGSMVPEAFGFGYIKALAENFYGISDVELIQASGLDIVGADVSAIMDQTIKDIMRDSSCIISLNPWKDEG